MNVAVVCCYFNFTKSPFRYKNYSIFQKNIRKYNIKLLTVEFDPNSAFEIKKEDADCVIHLSNGDLMWQKERLLNIGIDALPTNTDIVVIADTDIVFGVEDFVEKLVHSLSEYKVVQCFSKTLAFNPLLELDNINFFKLNHELTYNYCDTGVSVVSNYTQNGNLQSPLNAFGLAWAFRYKLLKEVKMFDKNIIGSGDKMLFGALYNIWFGNELAGLNGVPYADYVKKIRDFIDLNEVGFIKNTTVYSLYHGELVNRQYSNRHNILKMHGFDAVRDLIDIPNQPFKFTNTVSDSLKQNIENYFYNRKDTLPLPPSLY